MIQDTAEAEKLARAIVQDLVFYGTLRDAEMVAEGRALFVSRVVPSLHARFEEALETAVHRAPPLGERRPGDHDPGAPRPVGGTSVRAAAVAGVFVVAAVAVATYLFIR